MNNKVWRGWAALAALTGLVGVGLVGVGAANAQSDNVRHSDEDVRLQEIVEEMTLEEKLGQLNLVAGGTDKALNSLLDDEMEADVRAGRIGGFLHVSGAERLAALQRIAVEESEHGAPLYFAMDVIHGYRTVFPVPLGLASAWDPDLMEATARVAAVEASAAGLHWTFSPMIDVSRDPRWGRIVEGAGEDAYLSAALGAAQVRGYQGADLSASDTIMATAKHFVAYGAGLGGRDYESVDISERTLREVYLPPFYAAADAGVASFMASFNDIAGKPVTANARLLRDFLRGQWGFEGVVMSDWNAIGELLSHGVAETRADAGALALRAGVDLDMTSGIYSDDVAARVAESPDLETFVNEAALRVMRAKAKLGLFEDPYRYNDAAREGRVMLSAEHRAVAREAAEKSLVLLKNEDGVLPLSSEVERIAVIGGLANDRRSMLGSWAGRGRATDAESLLAALREAMPEVRIDAQLAIGPRPLEDEDEIEDGIEDAARAARRADVALLVLGEDYDMSGEARSRSSVALPGAQLEMARAVLETDTPVVVVLMNGRPMDVAEVAAGADAVLETWFPGVEGGAAVVAALLGDVAPSGKLPAAMPRTTGQAPYAYDHLNTGRPAGAAPAPYTSGYTDVSVLPAFPFGHGLSYTEFGYGDLELSSTRLAPGEAVEVRAFLVNIGERAGTEVVQLYVRDKVASVARPTKQLRGFARLEMAPGEAVQIVFTLEPEQFAFFDDIGEWSYEAGEIEIMVGASSEDIRARATLRLEDGGKADAPPAAVWTPVSIERQ